MHTKHNEVYTLSLSTGMKHDNVIVMVITLVPLVEQSNKKSAIIWVTHCNYDMVFIAVVVFPLVKA